MDIAPYVNALGPTGVLVAFLVAMMRLLGPVVRDYFVEGTKAFRALADLAPNLHQDLVDLRVDMRATREDMASIKVMLQQEPRAGGRARQIGRDS